MGLWQLREKIKQGAGKIQDIKKIEKELMHSFEEELSEMKKSLQAKSCPAFANADLQDGGCQSYSTYSTQAITLSCRDDRKSPVDIVTMKSVAEIKCVKQPLSNLYWDRDVSNIKCIQDCHHRNKTYAVGQLRELESKKGFRWISDKGNTITHVKCVVTETLSSGFEYHKEKDINECKEGLDCGQKGTCINTRGSFYCDCQSGYENSTKRDACRDIDECTNQETCPGGTCSNIPGSYR